MGHVVRCECGFEARAQDHDALITQVQQHAWDAHGMALTRDDAIQLAQRAPEETTTNSMTGDQA